MPKVDNFSIIVADCHSDRHPSRAFPARQYSYFVAYYLPLHPHYPTTNKLPVLRATQQNKKCNFLVCHRLWRKVPVQNCSKFGAVKVWGGPGNNFL